jgi:lysozyme
MTLQSNLIAAEGKRYSLYKDIRGLDSLGVGHCIAVKPLSDAAVMQILNDDIADARAEVLQSLPWTTSLDSVRMDTLIEMAFNLGIGGLMKFTDTLAAVKAGAWQAAHDALLNNPHWIAEVGLPRVTRLANQLLTGTET